MQAVSSDPTCERKSTNYVNQPALATLLVTRGFVAYRSHFDLLAAFFQTKNVNEERDCLQSTSTEEINKGSLYSNVLLCLSDLK